MNPVRNIKHSRIEKISNGVEITIKNLQKKIPIHPKRIKEVVLKTLSKECIKKSGEITICFVSDRKIRRLNLKYLGKNSPTDVITFDITESKDLNNIFADIVISTDTAVSNARIFKTTPLYELYLYVIHGVLHLLGYDDKSKKDRLIMHKKEKSLLHRLSQMKRRR